MQTTKPDQRFSTNLAALRGIAASVVVVFHALLVYLVADFDNPHQQPLGFEIPWGATNTALLAAFNGHAAVIIFFVLSGLVLSLSYEHQRGGGVYRLSAYFIKRAARLWPLLVAAALFAMVVRHLSVEGRDPTIFSTWVNSYFVPPADLVALVRNIIGLSPSLNYPAWTIYIEIAASILFPAMYLLSRNRLLLGIAIAGAVALTLSGWNYRGFAQYMVCFMAGIALVRHGAPIADAFLAQARWLRITMLALAWVVIFAFERVYSPTEHYNPMMVIVLTASSTIIVGHLYYAKSIDLLARPVLQWLGEISYGIYLLHFPVLIGLAHLAAPLIGEPGPGAALAFNLMLALATLSITIPLAAFSYKLVEKPCQNAGRMIAALIERRAVSAAQHPAPEREAHSVSTTYRKREFAG